MAAPASLAGAVLSAGAAAGAEADMSEAGAADWSSFFEQPTVTTVAARSVASNRGSFFIWSSFYIWRKPLRKNLQSSGALWR